MESVEAALVTESWVSFSAVGTQEGGGSTGVFGVVRGSTFGTDGRRPTVLVWMAELPTAVALTRPVYERFHCESAAAYDDVVR